MKKILTFLFLIMMFSMIQAPTAEAWTGKTHSDIASQVYYSLPADVQTKLSLKDMRDGSDDPDFKFFDYSYHKYPASYSKATQWLDQGQLAYQNGDYKMASYCFGVASHYISDSFAAPHCVDGTLGYHTIYELQAILLTPQITPCSGDLKSALESGHVNGEYDWNSWMMSRSDIYVQKDLNQAASTSYVAIKSRIS